MIAIWFSGKQVFECFEVFRENPSILSRRMDRVELKLSEAICSSSWKASSASPSGAKSCASSRDWENPASVFSNEVRYLARSLGFISLTLAASSDFMALTLSLILVTAPTSEDLDLFTAAMSAGGLLLELIVGRVENLG